MTPTLFGRDAPAILGSASLVGTFVIAFLTSFLYFRLYLAEEFTRSDLDALRTQKQFDEARQKGRTQAIGPKQVLQATQESSAIPLPQGTTHDAGAKADGQALTATLSQAIEQKLAQMRDHPLDPSDPAKGAFRGKSSVSSPPRSLSATVKPVRGENNWFKIDLLLTSGDPKLRDEVVFFYHPTFKVPYERVRVAGGQAPVRLYAYGAFTVGVLADGGKTELELDLTTVEGAPEAFLEN